MNSATLAAAGEAQVDLPWVSQTTPRQEFTCPGHSTACPWAAAVPQGGSFLVVRTPLLPRPLASCITLFSGALSVVQASGFQRQRCYLKPLLFVSLTLAATSCCRSMQAHPGRASQRKAANEEQVQRRLFFVLITKQLPKQHPSALCWAAIYSSLFPGHAGSFLQPAMPWESSSGTEMEAFCPRSPGNCSEGCPVPAFSYSRASQGQGESRLNPESAPCTARAAGGPRGPSPSGQHRCICPLAPCG